MSECEAYEVLANLALDEEATLEEIAELNRHLETCPDCRAYYEDIKRIHGAFAPQRAVLPESFSSRVMAQVRGTDQDPKEKPEKKVVPFPHWGRWAALAACCAVVALSAWAAGSPGGVKGDTAAVAQMARDALPEVKTAQADEDLRENGISVLSEDPSPVGPEAYKEPDASAAGDSLDDGQLEDAKSALEVEPTGGSVPDYYRADGEAASDDVGWDRDSTENEDSQPAAADAPESPEATEATENTEDAEDTEELEASVPESTPPASEEDVSPAEIVNAPEPGILIAYSGGAAQDWVESVLGLEWAAGGSYPLSAEQYAELLDLLNQAGEPYQIEPGEGYCLMTE